MRGSWTKHVAGREADINLKVDAENLGIGLILKIAIGHSEPRLI